LNYQFKNSILTKTLNIPETNNTLFFKFHNIQNVPTPNAQIKSQSDYFLIFWNNIILNKNFNNNNFLTYTDFVDSSRYIKKQQGIKLPLRIIKLNANWTETKKNYLIHDLITDQVQFKLKMYQIQAIW